MDAYSGNGTEAARTAGYRGSEAVLAQVAHENMRKPGIAEAISARELGRRDKLIATREERQAFWSSLMRDGGRDGFERLKASELLGKSEADFTDKTEHSAAGAISISINGVATKPKENP